MAAIKEDTGEIQATGVPACCPTCPTNPQWDWQVAAAVAVVLMVVMMMMVVAAVVAALPVVVMLVAVVFVPTC